jgi:hypothetical protein
MSGAIHPLPQYAFMAWCLVKAQGQLYLFYCLTVTERKRMKVVQEEEVYIKRKGRKMQKDAKRRVEGTGKTVPVLAPRHDV